MEDNLVLILIIVGAAVLVLLLLWVLRLRRRTAFLVQCQVTLCHELDRRLNDFNQRILQTVSGPLDQEAFAPLPSLNRIRQFSAPLLGRNNEDETAAAAAGTEATSEPSTTVAGSTQQPAGSAFSSHVVPAALQPLATPEVILGATLLELLSSEVLYDYYRFYQGTTNNTAATAATTSASSSSLPAGRRSAEQQQQPEVVDVATLHQRLRASNELFLFVRERSQEVYQAAKLLFAPDQPGDLFSHDGVESDNTSQRQQQHPPRGFASRDPVLQTFPAPRSPSFFRLLCLYRSWERKCFKRERLRLYYVLQHRWCSGQLAPSRGGVDDDDADAAHQQQSSSSRGNKKRNAATEVDYGDDVDDESQEEMRPNQQQQQNRLPGQSLPSERRLQFGPRSVVKAEFLSLHGGSSGAVVSCNGYLAPSLYEPLVRMTPHAVHRRAQQQQQQTSSSSSSSATTSLRHRSTATMDEEETERCLERAMQCAPAEVRVPDDDVDGGGDDGDAADLGVARALRDVVEEAMIANCTVAGRGALQRLQAGEDASVHRLTSLMAVRASWGGGGEHAQDDDDEADADPIGGASSSHKKKKRAKKSHTTENYLDARTVRILRRDEEDDSGQLTGRGSDAAEENNNSLFFWFPTPLWDDWYFSGGGAAMDTRNAIIAALANLKRVIEEDRGPELANASQHDKLEGLVAKLRQPRPMYDTFLRFDAAVKQWLLTTARALHEEVLQRWKQQVIAAASKRLKPYQSVQFVAEQLQELRRRDASPAGSTSPSAVKRRAAAAASDSARTTGRRELPPIKKLLTDFWINEETLLRDALSTVSFIHQSGSSSGSSVPSVCRCACCLPKLPLFETLTEDNDSGTYKLLERRLRMRCIHAFATECEVLDAKRLLAPVTSELLDLLFPKSNSVALSAVGPEEVDWRDEEQLAEQRGERRAERMKEWLSKVAQQSNAPTPPPSSSDASGPVPPPRGNDDDPPMAPPRNNHDSNNNIRSNKSRCEYEWAPMPADPFESSQTPNPQQQTRANYWDQEVSRAVREATSDVERLIAQSITQIEANVIRHVIAADGSATAISSSSSSPGSAFERNASTTKAADPPSTPGTTKAAPPSSTIGADRELREFSSSVLSIGSDALQTAAKRYTVLRLIYQRVRHLCAVGAESSAGIISQIPSSSTNHNHAGGDAGGALTTRQRDRLLRALLQLREALVDAKNLVVQDAHRSLSSGEGSSPPGGSGGSGSAALSSSILTWRKKRVGDVEQETRGQSSSAAAAVVAVDAFTQKPKDYVFPWHGVYGAYNYYAEVLQQDPITLKFVFEAVR